MSDDLSNRGQQDRTRININEEHEVRYWSEKFKVSAQTLKAAVEAAGPMAKDVEKRLQSKPN